MFKSICIAIALIAIISYNSDTSSLESWKKTAGNVAVGMTALVKESGHTLHQVLREDDTLADHVSNAAEDALYALNDHATIAKVAGAVINSQLHVSLL